jgi:hypothetical protein
VGEETFRLTQQYVDDIIIVDTDAICAAIKDVFTDTRSILEPAGALAVAGAKAYIERAALTKDPIKNETLITIACGANMNFDRLRFVAERAELGEAREALFAVTCRSSAAASSACASWSARATSPSSTTASATRMTRTCSAACRSPTAANRARWRAASRSTASRRWT